MNRDEILALAIESGFEEIAEHEFAGYTNTLEAFAFRKSEG